MLSQKLRIRKTVCDVIAVMPQSFSGTTVGAAPDIWVPLTMQAEVYPGEDWLTVEKHPIEKTEWLQVMGRLKPGVTVAQAKASLDLTFQQYLQSQLGGITENDRHNLLNEHLPVSDGRRGASMLQDEFGTPLLILMGVVGLVLGVAADAKYNSVREKTPRRFHVPFFHPIGEVSFARMEVRAVGNPSSLAAAVRAAVKQTAPNLPPVEIQTMNDL